VLARLSCFGRDGASVGEVLATYDPALRMLNRLRSAGINKFTATGRTGGGVDFCTQILYIARTPISDSRIVMHDQVEVLLFPGTVRCFRARFFQRATF
jgi:hypothetical protein